MKDEGKHLSERKRELPYFFLAQPIERGARRGLMFPACRVCGRDHHHEVTWAPETTDVERADAVRVNETCNACWFWFVSTWMTS